MSALFKVAEGVPCRACGATLAPAHENVFGLCDNCWTQLGMFLGSSFDKRRLTQPERDGGITSEEVNAWLASKLVKDLKRLERTGLSARCEALSAWAYGRPGTQCAKVATRVRDGHYACHRHFLSTSPIWVSEARADPYATLRDLIERLMLQDERFTEIIIEAALPKPARKPKVMK